MNQLLCFLSFVMCVEFSYAQPKVDSNFHIYLLAGQSNMAGRGLMTDSIRAIGDPNVYMLNKNNEWVPAHHPLHFDKPRVAGVGPGLAFGIAMAQNRPGITIGLVPCAVGGSSIKAWQPGAYDSATKTHPYDDAAKRIQVAMQSGVCKGILWLQGESDSNPDDAAAYLPKLTQLISRFRNMIGNGDLPFVAGELGAYKQQYSTINKVLKQLPATVSHTSVASSESLTDIGDLTHFNAASADEMGKRMAEKMKLLQLK